MMMTTMMARQISPPMETVFELTLVFFAAVVLVAPPAAPGGGPAAEGRRHAAKVDAHRAAPVMSGDGVGLDEAGAAKASTAIAAPAGTRYRRTPVTVRLPCQSRLDWIAHPTGAIAAPPK